MIKKGKYLSSARKEIPLKIGKRDIPNAIEALGALGYTKGIVAIRKIYKYVYGEIEFAVSDIAKVNDDLSIIPSQAFFFEAEMIVDEEEVGNAKKEISHLLNKLGLNQIDEEKFREYVLNEVNDILPHLKMGVSNGFVAIFSSWFIGAVCGGRTRRIDSVSGGLTSRMPCGTLNILVAEVRSF